MVGAPNYWWEALAPWLYIDTPLSRFSSLSISIYQEANQSIVLPLQIRASPISQLGVLHRLFKLELELIVSC